MKVESYADIRHDLVTCLTIFLAAPVTYAEITHQEKLPEKTGQARGLTPTCALLKLN
jgi:hypothetical protein